MIDAAACRNPFAAFPGRPSDRAEPDALVTREWLVTNGLGGYASGTVSGVITRRYHGVLIAALPAPLGRIVMLSHIAEQVPLRRRPARRDRRTRADRADARTRTAPAI